MAATATVTRPSTGEKILVRLDGVDRMSGRVIFVVPAYQARFVFERGLRFSQLTADGRQELSAAEVQVENVEVVGLITHVPRSVYQKMAQWAWAILTDVRERGIADVQSFG